MEKETVAATPAMMRGIRIPSATEILGRVGVHDAKGFHREVVLTEDHRVLIVTAEMTPRGWVVTWCPSFGAFTRVVHAFTQAA